MSPLVSGLALRCPASLFIPGHTGLSPDDHFIIYSLIST
jgi:hypothetical protein